MSEKEKSEYYQANHQFFSIISELKESLTISKVEDERQFLSEILRLGGLGQ